MCYQQTFFCILAGRSESNVKMLIIEDPFMISHFTINNLIDIFPKGEMTYQEVLERVTNDYS